MVAFSRLERIFEGLHRWRYALAPLSFAFGVGSFLLISRKPWIAQWLAVLLLVTWVASVLELIVPRKAPPGLLRFLTQQTHQEAFFFTLPFLLRTTSWQTGQGVFTAGVIVAALCSMWDPLYFGVIAKRRWLYLGFHALAVYLVILVSLPLLLQLTTSETLALAAVAVALVAAPSLGEDSGKRGIDTGLWMFFGGIVLAAAAWYGRANVPPATLWVGDAAITTRMLESQRLPAERLDEVPLAVARDQGIYAYTAIVVPRGLREKVFHRWRTPGQPMVDIPLEVSGGREEGYRAWTHKTGFNAPGRWRVQVVTESGQLLGELRFVVVEGAASTKEQQPEPPPAMREELPPPPPKIETPPPQQESAPPVEQLPSEPPPLEVPPPQEEAQPEPAPPPPVPKAQPQAPPAQVAPQPQQEEEDSDEEESDEPANPVPSTPGSSTP